MIAIGKDSRLLRGLLAGVSMSVLMLTGTTGPASAFTPNVQDQLERYFYCLGLLLTDPIRQAEECGPPRDRRGLESLSTLVSGAPTEDYPPSCPEYHSWDGYDCVPWV